MLRTVLRMTVRAGATEEFRQAWSRTAKLAAAMPGSVAQTLLCDPADPAVHLIMADWADQASLDAFQGSEHRRALSAQLDTFRESADKSVLDVVEYVPGTTRP
ncbi:antibiotic biosynthesis monooxygenase family protein [Actinacidiphila epipremni]|jgi:quinol monooxygenase YgiN|uniref:Antibiotic biosynthesis monooxygenase n=1 Tax=Actinacidiphila epipremni TaxID=2053013 RepID=A0ABX1A0K0_9ACTN|nr:antibiotic biosynthesis monooxygenase family protein [Actinacidiphila epipremni]NJP47326.1 antibiotic biosynthesis monooxygenase [Actinacidiphila epipremni]